MVNELTLIDDVTELLKKLLIENVDEFQNNPNSISLEPPSEKPPTQNGLSLFLYQVSENPFLKNQELLDTNTNMLQYPPLILDLFYIITPFSSAKSNPKSVEQMILAKVMQTLYDNAILKGPVLGNSLLDSGNTELRIVLNTLPLEQLHHLWGTFSNIPYNLSISYVVTPLKIPSTRMLKTRRVDTKELDFYQINSGTL